MYLDSFCSTVDSLRETSRTVIQGVTIWFGWILKWLYKHIYKLLYLNWFGKIIDFDFNTVPLNGFEHPLKGLHGSCQCWFYNDLAGCLKFSNAMVEVEESIWSNVVQWLVRWLYWSPEQHARRNLPASWSATCCCISPGLPTDIPSPTKFPPQLLSLDFSNTLVVHSLLVIDYDISLITYVIVLTLKYDNRRNINTVFYRRERKVIMQWQTWRKI